MAVLATTGPTGPHLVPIVFAVIDDRIVSIVDHKPKRTNDLRRLRNITADSRVSLLVQDFHVDWSRLWWVRADGEASIHEHGAEWERSVAALAERHEQYRDTRPSGRIIVVDVQRWVGWEATQTVP